MTDAPHGGIASVASQLLLFYREPARFRPFYIHGQEPPPEGHIVLKLALARFSPGWAHELPAHDRQELVHAARAFVRQVCLRDRATHYQLLCLDERAGADAMKENYRLLMALIHPDRQEGVAHEWPLDGAQRVNEAYAALSDPASRAAYDESLRRAHLPAAHEHLVTPHAPAHPARRRGGWLRPASLVGVMLVLVYAMQVWWMGTTPQHYALLERAARFIHERPAVAFDPLEHFKPSTQRMQLAGMRVVAPASEPAASADFPELRPVLDRRPARIDIAAAPSPDGQPLRLAQADAAPAPMPPAPAAVPEPGPPSTEDVELLVALLVSAYESGNPDGVMSLFDTKALGMWREWSIRNTYTEFFRATRSRKLRLDRLTWTTEGFSAHAKGGATVTAVYADAGNTVERKVDVQIDITTRDGQASITRLSLFPGDK